MLVGFISSIFKQPLANFETLKLATLMLWNPRSPTTQSSRSFWNGSEAWNGTQLHGENNAPLYASLLGFECFGCFMMFLLTLIQCQERFHRFPKFGSVLFFCKCLAAKRGFAVWRGLCTFNFSGFGTALVGSSNMKGTKKHRI